LEAILGINRSAEAFGYSGYHSDKDLDRFAVRHHGALNAVPNLDRMVLSTDSTFLYLDRYAEA
jgi:hypothetical protein